MNIIRDAVISFIFILLGFWFFGIEVRVIEAAESDNATIKGDEVPLYLETSSASRIVRPLRKGEMVTVEIEIEGSGYNWCGVVEQGQTSLAGYVRCDSLERSACQKKIWLRLGSQSERNGDINETKVTVVANQVLVPVTLVYRGTTVEAVLVLDTGASVTMINKGVAARLGINPAETLKGEGQVVGGAIVEAAFAKVDYISVGPHTRMDVAISIVEEKDLRIKRDGLLGMNFLRDLKYYVDFKNQLIRWSY